MAFAIYLAKHIGQFPGIVGDQSRPVGIGRENGKLPVATLLKLPKGPVKPDTARGNV